MSPDVALALAVGLFATAAVGSFAWMALSSGLDVALQVYGIVAAILVFATIVSLLFVYGVTGQVPW